MYAVINHFTLKTPVDQDLIDAMQRDLIPQARAYPGVRDFHFIRDADDHVIVAVFFDTMEALEGSTKEIAAPWFAEHVGPYVARPPDRRVGEVVASTAFEVS